MNEYTFQDIEIGHTEEFDAIVTEAMLDSFMQLSGDDNPLHMDEDFAKKHGFEGRVVYGVLLEAFYSKLVGVYLPGKNCIFNKCEIEWKKPAYTDMPLHIKGTVVDKREGTQRLVIEAKMTDEAGNVLNKAKLWVGFTRTQG